MLLESHILSSNLSIFFTHIQSLQDNHVVSLCFPKFLWGNDLRISGGIVFRALFGDQWHWGIFEGGSLRRGITTIVVADFEISHGFVRFVFEELLQEFQLFPHLD